MKFRSKIAALFRAQKIDTEMSEEMRLHLERRIEENIAAGMLPDEARYAALRKFGGVEQVKELARAQRTGVWFELLGRDLKAGVRSVARSPRFALIAVVTLAVGIGVNLAVLALANAILVRPLPGIRGAERLVIVARVPRDHGPRAATWTELQAFRTGAPALAQVAAVATAPFAVLADDLTERVLGQFASANLFSTLGVRVAAGRGFLASEEIGDGKLVAVISDRLWQRRWQRDPSIVGRLVRLNGHACTIVGVAEPGFRGVQLPSSHDIWLPLSARSVVQEGARPLDDPRSHWLTTLVGRLASGASIEQAQQQLEATARAMESRPAGQEQEWAPRSRPYGPFPGNHNAALMFLGLLIAFAVLVFGVVSANVAALFLARALARRQEIAVRLALGGSRGRVVRQMIMEGLVVAAGACALGLVGAQFAADYIVGQIPGDFDEAAMLNVVIDWRVALAAAALIFATALAVAWVPAWQGAGIDLVGALKSGPSAGSGRRSRLRDLLVVMQVALCVVLVVSASLMKQSLARLEAEDLGAMSRILVARLDPTLGRSDEPRRRAAIDEVVERARNLPGVESAALVSNPPFGDATGINLGDAYGGKVDAAAAISAQANVIGPDYFQTLGVPLLRGRDFSVADAAGAPAVAIVNSRLAEALWPGEDPVGQLLRVNRRDDTGRIVVGVVPIDDPRAPQRTFFVPLAQRPVGPISILLRTTTDAHALAPALRTIVRETNADMPVFHVATMKAARDRTLWQQRIVASLVTFCSGAAAVLAMLGLYAAVAQEVLRRTREIGIRFALGATRTDVFGLMLRQGMRLTLVGVGFGLIGASAVARLLRKLLVGVTPTDAITYAVAAAVLFGVGALACWLPARRAAKVDPMVALRTE